MQAKFDVIVVGGGHAGSEAALAAARMGASTLLITQNIETLGQMSCNPAIGGIGKSHLVREIDALGGVMAEAADLAGIHFRVLNARKGPAVRATRAQTDRQLYKQVVRSRLENQVNLSIFQQSVDDLVVSGERVVGVVTAMQQTFYAPSVVLTVGTFLGGVIHVGLNQNSGGPVIQRPTGWQIGCEQWILRLAGSRPAHRQGLTQDLWIFRNWRFNLAMTRYLDYLFGQNQGVSLNRFLVILPIPHQKPMT